MFPMIGIHQMPELVTPKEMYHPHLHRCVADTKDSVAKLTIEIVALQLGRYNAVVLSIFPP